MNLRYNFSHCCPINAEPWTYVLQNNQIKKENIDVVAPEK